MAAAAADQAPRRLGFAPAIPVPAVPDSVLRTERPLPALAVYHPELAHGGAEGAGVEGASAPVTEQCPVPQLRLAEGIDRHRASI